MAVTQQFIIEIEAGKLIDDGVDHCITILLPGRAAAEALYADLRGALGLGGTLAYPSQQEPYVPAATYQGMGGGPYVPAEDATIRRMIREFEEPASKDAEDMSTWSAEQLEEFFATAGEPDDPEMVSDAEAEQVPTDPDAAAAAKQALSRRELQMQDPENKNSFTPHVSSVVPPSSPRGSTFGAIHLHQDPPQAF